MFDFRYFKKIDMHSHIGTWGNPFNFSGDINLILELMEKFNIEKTLSNKRNNYTKFRGEWSQELFWKMSWF